MNLKKWTTALTLCAVTLAATTTGITPALAADDTAAVENVGPNLQAAADAMNAATQHLNAGGVNSNNNGSTGNQQPGDTDLLGYDYITLSEKAIVENGQAYLPIRSTFAAMKTAAMELEWKPQNQQKIKLTGAQGTYELYLTADETGIQLQKGAATYPIKTVNGVRYVAIGLFQAIIQNAQVQLSGNDLLVLKDKAGTTIWNPNSAFWYNMNTYQAPAAPPVQAPAPQPQPQPEINYPDTTPQQPTQPQQPQQPQKPDVPNINVPNNTIGGKIVNNALQYLGVPYVWGGNTPAGFDCSGLVQYVYAQLGISLPRTSYEQQAVATPISLVALQPGDLVFWGASAYHVGIYIGNGQFIHAPAPGQNVKIQTYAEYSYTGAGRIIA